MNEYYTIKGAMEQLGIKTINGLRHIEKKYPDAFVLVNDPQDKYPRYDKTTLDKFVAMRHYFSQEKP